GMIYVEQRKYEKARIEFRNVIDSGHKELSPLAQFGIAQTYFAEANYEKAIDGYKKVIDNYRTTESAEDAQFYIGWSYQRLAKYDEAILQLEEAIELFPYNENAPNSQFFIGQIYYAKKDYQGAIEAYRKVADNTTFDYNTRRSAQYWIARLLEENNDIDGAVGAYQQLLRNFPELHQTPSHPSNNVNENYIQKLRSEQL
ncbi:TPA: tetratricopeptide repeat protein, partial [Candidatus Poribacteria bacterium]|nr:tetratricopeptide repeat protein [Candidatus Poribacteria bacterium]